MQNVGNLFNRVLKLVYSKYDKKVPKINTNLEYIKQNYNVDY